MRGDSSRSHPHLNAPRPVLSVSVPCAGSVTTKTLSNAPKQDLRVWLEQMEAAGELVTVTGAERDEEIGGIVDIYQRTMGAPAVMFDDIPGFPRGRRVVANILTSVRRINLTLGMPADTSEMDLVRYWRAYMKNPETIPPVIVDDAIMSST